MVLIFSLLFPFFNIGGGGCLILGFKGKQVTFHVSFALVFGGVHFAVAELFSLRTLCSEMIFCTARSVTRL